jgi:hypothetical protein
LNAAQLDLKQVSSRLFRARGGLFFDAHPLLKATLKNTPLPSYLKRWNLAVLDHAV